MHRTPVRIYRVTPAADATRYELARPDEFFARLPQAFRSFPMQSMHHALPVPARMNASPPTDFGWLMPGAIVWTRLLDDDDHYTLESDILRAVSEFLKLDVSGSQRAHFAVNPPICNALDVANSSVRRDEGGRIVGIDRYAFHRYRLPTSLFRLPQGSDWEVFTTFLLEPDPDLPFMDLYAAYEKLGLSGLDFTAVWEGEIDS